ncbi:MAG: 3-keto-5-aminohexanoate cleavage protein [Actinobacteria bacterium]|nr:3-keto-5-aminohexanoate cleavage protein [Actinomycetota bacterium]
MITVAPTGAELAPDAHPALPTTPEAIVETAVECEEAGARVVHVHARDGEGRSTMDVGVFREVLAGLRDRTELVVQFTTGGAVGDPDDARLSPLDLRPDMASLTCGSVNFGDEVFLNPFPLMRRLYERMAELGVLPELELFDAGHLVNGRRLVGDEPTHHVHCDLVLGVPGGLTGTVTDVVDLVERIPSGWTFSATGIGRAHLTVTAAALALGGHVRTGFEDVVHYGPGRHARDNAELVQRVVRLGDELGRPLATAAETRSILGLSSVANAA